MSGTYRVEASPTRRAGCQATECKRAGIKIQVGELRFGTFVTIQDNQSWRWKHWGCVTPKQISNLKDSVDGELEKYLDGYENLEDYDKDRVAKAVEEGHVADEDWRGDVEVNRPGKKGFHTPASKKKAREEATAQREAAEDGNDSPSVPAEKKKRNRAKKKANAEDGDEPAPKKAKAAPKKGKKVKAEDVSEEEHQPKKSRKKTAKTKIEDESDPVIKADHYDDNVTVPPMKKQRATRKAAPKKVKSEDIDPEDDEPMLAPDGNDQAIDTEDEDFEEEVETGEEVPKAKQGRRPAVKKGTNGTVAISEPKPKPKQKKAAASPASKKPTRTSGRTAHSQDT